MAGGAWPAAWRLDWNRDRSSLVSAQSSECDPQRNMRPELLFLYAVGQVQIQRADRTAPAHASADAAVERAVIPAVGSGADIVKHCAAPALGEPVLILGAAGHQVFGWIDGTVLLIADAVVAVTAHRVIATGAKQQRGWNFGGAAAGEDAAEFCTQNHNIALGHWKILFEAGVHAREGLIGDHAFDGKTGLQRKQIALAREDRVVDVAPGPRKTRHQRLVLALCDDGIGG